jgi:hypothetical protein
MTDDTETTRDPDLTLLLIDWVASTAAADEREQKMHDLVARVGQENIVLAQQVDTSSGGPNALVIVERSEALWAQLEELHGEGWRFQRHDLLQEWWDGREGKWRGGTNPGFVPGG